MKIPAPKLLILLGCLAASVIVAGVFLVRRHRTRLPTQIQFPRYPHQHLPSSEWEASAKLRATSYTLREGETLAYVARLRYGHQNYFSVIKVYNHIENEALVKAGTPLRLPDISTILAEEGFTKVAGAEAEMILCSRAKYDRVESQLWDLRKDRDRGRVIVPEKIRQELLEAADDLQQATEGLKAARPGVTRAPDKTIRQLEQVMSAMRDLAEGTNDGYGYDIDLVQQRYALALIYAIIWAREGFN